MSRPTLEVADIFRRHGAAYRARHRLPLQHLKLMRAIETCRTGALGGHVERCGHCQHQRISYNSCRNRHCPKCQNLARAQWLSRRKEELLPIDYFHVVFTVPEQLAALALQNKRVLYNLMFRASAETLLTIAGDRKHLGAEIGFFSVLHTWGQNLLFHPHIHCVATGGGLLSDGQGWRDCRPGFFLPVRVLSRLFRRLFLDGLRQAFARGELVFFNRLAPLADPAAFAAYVDPLAQTEWVVYAKPPFGGANQVLEYLGRYTHRVALSNERLLALASDQVTFRFKDYRAAGRPKQRTMTVPAEEFIRRFLLHVLPPGFQRIRSYGLLANRFKRDLLAAARRALASAVTTLLPPVIDHQRQLRELVERLRRCPRCGVGVMIRCLPPIPPWYPIRLKPLDTS